MNIAFASVTFSTFHELISALNALQPENMELVLIAERILHLERSALKLAH